MLNHHAVLTREKLAEKMYETRNNLTSSVIFVDSQFCVFQGNPKLAILVLSARERYEQRLIFFRKYLGIKFVILDMEKDFLESASSIPSELKFLTDGLDQEQHKLSDVLRDCGIFAEKINLLHKSLSRAAEKLHERLLFSTVFNRIFQEACDCSPLSLQPWRYFPLAQSGQIRIGILTIFRSIAIPPHDHPGACGAQFVLSGKIRIRQYDFKDGLSYSKAHVVTLVQSLDGNIVRKGCSTYLHNHRNIHELQSVTPRTVILSLEVNRFQPKERSWYYPADLFYKSRERIYTRVTRNRNLVVS